MAFKMYHEQDCDISKLDGKHVNATDKDTTRL